jgi:ATP-binding cassette subfamily F protein 3
MVHLVNITRQHGDRILFRETNFQILPGPNGAGKSTI